MIIPIYRDWSPHIRTNTQAASHRLVARHSTKPLTQRKLRRFYLRSRKRLVRYSLLTANVALLGVVVFFVAKSPAGNQTIHQNAVADAASSETPAGPLDQVSSADIAVHIARTVGLPEANSVVNHADSVSASETSVPADTSIVAKPQVVSAALPSRQDIHTYTVVAGDTIGSIAAKSGVSSDSIRGSNGLSGDRVAAGRQIVLPPAGTNGIVYTVKAGDTPDTLAQKFNANKDAIVSFNDAEISGLQPGEQVLIPDGVVQAVAAAPSYNYYSSGVGFAWGGNAPIYGHNGYDYGWCTYYVATKVNVPANWGNANTWDSGARASGWIISSTPRVGAVAQSDRMSYLGHVAYVEAVSDDGTMIKYSDMNGLAGWGRVGYSDWVSTGTFPNYIYQ
ncbi:MAG TPA: LysM peptidoglycan-binding domain-containing protein [Candidatus Saccharimonadales bacterium]|nr:LysM peptidoglycan-binding domain-containing protein [Candidatus Saccharimonadales bacterium]